MYDADENTYKMASFCIEGNIIDHTWPFIITKESGKPDHIAVTLLAHIVYWYRPTYNHLPDGSVVLGKKYKADLLQRSYIEIENMLGLTKREAQEAFQRLEILGVAFRELRTVEIGGQKISNVLFIRLDQDVLSMKREVFLKKCISSYAKKDEVLRQKGLAPTPNVMTYTYNTTKITQEKQQQHAEPKEDAAAAFPTSEFSITPNPLRQQPIPPPPPSSPVTPIAIPPQQPKRIYDILQKVDIPEADKIEITSRYDEDTVKNAIEWSRLPQTKITTTLVQALKWACLNKPQITLVAKPKEKAKPSFDPSSLNKTYYRQISTVSWQNGFRLDSYDMRELTEYLETNNDKIYFKQVSFLEQVSSYIRKKSIDCKNIFDMIKACQSDLKQQMST